MVDLRGLSFSYRRGVPTLTAASCAFEAGKLTAILGPNGSGKTTLVKIAAGLLRQESGEVIIDGRPAAEYGLPGLARILSYVPQKISFFPDVTVAEALMTGRRPYMGWEPARADRGRVAEVLGLLGLEALRDKNINEISGGEFQKTLIAQALVKEPRVMIFDEPLNNLDIKNQLRIMGVIKEITSSLGLACAIVIHDLNMAAKYCDRFVFMKDGRVEAAGGPEILGPEVIEKVFGVSARVEVFDGRPAVLY